MAPVIPLRLLLQYHEQNYSTELAPRSQTMSDSGAVCRFTYYTGFTVSRQFMTRLWNACTAVTSFEKFVSCKTICFSWFSAVFLLSLDFGLILNYSKFSAKHENKQYWIFSQDKAVSTQFANSKTYLKQKKLLNHYSYTSFAMFLPKYFFLNVLCILLEKVFVIINVF